MKKILFVAITLLSTLTLLTSCKKDQVTENRTYTYTMSKYVYGTNIELEAAIKSTMPQPFHNLGQIFLQNNYAFVCEFEKGVHVIDYRNPQQPKNISFINIPGCTDIAVRDHYLYSNCTTTGLVTVNIANPTQTKLEQILPDVIYKRYYTPDTNKVIINIEHIDTTVTDNMSGIMLASTSGSTGGQNGTGGSMAKFALLYNRLYAIDYGTLKIINTVNSASPQFVKKIQIPFDVETLYPFKNKLFIGSMSQMFIYDVADADAPQMQGSFGHARVCDPVIADSNYAYVTLRSNNLFESGGGMVCTGSTINELHVLDVSNVQSPTLLRTYKLDNPGGLTKSNNVLVICDGNAGLRFFDASNPTNIVNTHTFKNITAYDVIAQHNVAIAVTSKSLYFIGYTNNAEPTYTKQLSK